MFPCNFGASIFHFEFQYGYCCFCHLELITGSYNFFFYNFPQSWLVWLKDPSLMPVNLMLEWMICKFTFAFIFLTLFVDVLLVIFIISWTIFVLFAFNSFWWLSSNFRIIWYELMEQTWKWWTRFLHIVWWGLWYFWCYGTARESS